MIPKKTGRADLEHRRTAFFVTGLIIALAAVLISFEWTSIPRTSYSINSLNEIEFENEIIPVTRREEPRTLPEPATPEIMDMIDIVDNDIDVKDFIVDFEVTRDTRYDYYVPQVEPEVIKPEPDFFYKVEDMPEFNGGDPDIEFRKYIVKHLVYPEIAAINGVSGTVYVQFEIDPSGNLVNPVIYRGADPALDGEALRVILSSPRWTPGKQRGKAVKVRYIFPVRFVLQ